MQRAALVALQARNQLRAVNENAAPGQGIFFEEIRFV